MTAEEDLKILTLARAARARIGAVEGACVRDTGGRTYAAATVGLPSLSLSAIEVAVAMAVCAGASGLEAVALVGEGGEVTARDLSVVRDLGGEGTPVLKAGTDGALIAKVTA